MEADFPNNWVPAMEAVAKCACHQIGDRLLAMIEVSVADTRDGRPRWHC